eukprot:TRINITY_DN13196_c0_g1_i1.p1 TRINITY_DN13196_c0_g1~~TRINITY_DN13196_c0_g1_i1.p1  ORF type:complete len:212 (+),score=48.98 TRINITY_DN13196_c0_g1_i1:45-680(+)
MTEIRLVSADVESIDGLEASTEAVLLDLSDNRISSVKGLEQFPNLETLTLDNNQLETLEDMPVMGKLKTLWLNKNKIHDGDSTLDILAVKAPAVQYLSLMGNGCCKSELSGNSRDEVERYRLYTIYRLPSLQLLDFAPVSPAEREKAMTKGQFLKVSKAKEPDDTAIVEAQTNKLLEQASTKKQQPTFGKQRRFYTGKFSEGNRFIRDDVL